MSPLPSYNTLHQVNVLIFVFSRNSFCCQRSTKTVLQDVNLDFFLVQKKTTHYLIRKLKFTSSCHRKIISRTPVKSIVKSKPERTNKNQILVFDSSHTCRPPSDTASHNRGGGKEPASLPAFPAASLPTGLPAPPSASLARMSLPTGLGMVMVLGALSQTPEPAM